MDRSSAASTEREALEELVAAGYEIVLAANGMIRYVSDEGKGSIMAYDRWRVKMARAVDAGREIIRRDAAAAKPKRRRMRRGR